ncbi:ABC transporter [Coccidioides immitis RMSCC 2394]|uniref:ABC transporter n=1 Tax=Coccidioides immitis RMSCC 2394 TaxID=404692 RepID=A0A0J7ASS1_COCIT|nr:ABC transporter [Coccidioides immitis RMSCC 2394]
MVTLIYNHTLEIQDGLQFEGAALTLMSTENIVESLEPINEIWGSTIEMAIVCTFGQASVAKRIGQKRQMWTQAIQERVSTTASAP